MIPGSFTDFEINSQPEVWQATLQRVQEQWDSLAPQAKAFTSHPMVVIGCGSTYYLSLATAAVLRQAGVQAWAFPSSELVYFPLEVLPKGFNLLAISRSGTTSETLWAIERYRKQFPQGKVAVITCVPETPMVQQADLLLIAPDAQEQSVAQTRSFTSMTLLGQALAALATGDAARLQRLNGLPARLGKLLPEYTGLFEELGANPSLNRYFFLGSGPLYGIANEAMLKTKEMSSTWAEAFHFLEFRHGPMSVANENALVVGLVSDSAPEAELRVLREMKQLGAHTLAMVEHAANLDVQGIDHMVELRSGLNEWERGVFYLPLIQRMAYAHALSKGMNPDRPENLSAVIRLDSSAQ